MKAMKEINENQFMEWSDYFYVSTVSMFSLVSKHLTIWPSLLTVIAMLGYIHLILTAYAASLSLGNSSEQKSVKVET